LAFDQVVEPQTIFKGIWELPYPIYAWGTTANRAGRRRHGQARRGGARDAAAGRDAAWRLPTVRHRGLPPLFRISAIRRSPMAWTGRAAGSERYDAIPAG